MTAKARARPKRHKEEWQRWEFQRATETQKGPQTEK